MTSSTYKYNTVSDAANPLTAPLPPKPNRTPAERAIDRFAIEGNAIVTGGAGGLGLEATRALLEHGAHGVCIFDLSSAFETGRTSLQTLHAEFTDRKILEEIVDVTDEDAVKDAVERAAGALGSVDVLCCFAGIGNSMPMVDMSVELWKMVFDVNVTGSMICAKYAAKEMIKQRTPGSILLISSIAGHKSLFPLHAGAYSTSKHAVIGLTTNLAAELAPHGIRVNALCPGYINTNMTSSPQARMGIEKYVERTPLGRAGEREEVCGAVVLFCSGAGRYMTGVNVYIDGGNHVF